VRVNLMYLSPRTDGRRRNTIRPTNRKGKKWQANYALSKLTTSLQYNNKCCRQGSEQWFLIQLKEIIGEKLAKNVALYTLACKIWFFL